MIDITDAEFEQEIQNVIDKKISRVKLAKKLKTDWRTLNNKIQLLVTKNPELYQKFVAKCAYKPKEITEIPLRTMLIEFITQDYTLQELAQKYNIGERTLRRRIENLKHSEDMKERELYKLVKETANKHSHGKAAPNILIEQLQDLDIEPENITQDDKEKRRKQLIQIERRYNELCAFMPKEKAAATMGYTCNRIFKLLNELYCIEIQNIYLKEGTCIENQNDSTSEFKKKMQVKPEELDTKHTIEKKPEKTVEQEREQ